MQRAVWGLETGEECEEMEFPMSAGCTTVDLEGFYPRLSVHNIKNILYTYTHPLALHVRQYELTCPYPLSHIPGVLGFENHEE